MHWIGEDKDVEQIKISKQTSCAVRILRKYFSDQGVPENLVKRSVEGDWDAGNV